jgi:hypothetical protein
MADNNKLERVVEVDVKKANTSIKSIKTGLPSMEQVAAKAARSASAGIDGLTVGMVKGATAGNLLADSIKKAIEWAKEWTLGAAEHAAHTTPGGDPPPRHSLSWIVGANRLNRIVLAFRAFFSLLFGGRLSDSLMQKLGVIRRGAAKPAAAPAARPASDGALQIVAILQRDARLVDFMMEDIAAYPDEQVGAAVRGLHDQCRDALARHLKLEPVIDGVEGTYVKAPAGEGGLVKFIGNVQAAPPAGGTLRHKGWRAAKVDLPALSARQDVAVIAPAEIEVG